MSVRREMEHTASVDEESNEAFYHEGSLAWQPHLISNAELTLAVEDGLQCHRTHPVSQEDNKVLRPVRSQKDRQHRVEVHFQFRFNAAAVL